MDDTCPICYCSLGYAVTTTECGHKFCTGCLLNCMAKNTGSEKGSNRTKCPICRTDLIQGEVEPSFKFTTRLDDLTNEIDSLKNDAGFYKTRARFFEKKYSIISNRMAHLEEDYLKVQDASKIYKNIIYKLKEKYTYRDYTNAAIKFQKWSRVILAKKQLTLLKHRNAWKSYKSVIDKYYTSDGVKIKYKL